MCRRAKVRTTWTHFCQIQCLYTHLNIVDSVMLEVYNCFFCGKSSGKTAPTWRHSACSVVYFDQLLDAARTRKLVEILFFQLFSTSVSLLHILWCHSPQWFFGTNLVTMSENFKAEKFKFSNFLFWQLPTCQTVVQPQLFSLKGAEHRIQKTQTFTTSTSYFSNCMQNDVMSMPFCPTTFCKKKTFVYYYASRL